MIDAYTHLDMSAVQPVADLEQRMRVAGVDRALIVETWNGENRGCLQRLMASAAPAFRVAPCFRPNDEQSGAELLSSQMVRALRVRTADLHRLGPVTARLESMGKWLLPHGEAGIGTLTDELLQLVAFYPRLPIYLPHMGWPRRDKHDDNEWRNSISRLSKLPNLFVGVSAIAHFSQGAFPHDDVASFAAHLLSTFGRELLVAASDYPLFEKERYAQYIQLVHDWMGGSRQTGCGFESSLFGEQLEDGKG